jgi:hypothetical protein
MTQLSGCRFTDLVDEPVEFVYDLARVPRLGSFVLGH